MDHYIEIRVLPDPEFPEPVLMNALFAKLHRALCDAGRGEIGLSFPGLQEQRHTLGAVLRLHGAAPALARLMALDWLKGLRDYTQVSPVTPVPAGATHCSLLRKQFKSSPERLLRRSIKRGRMTPEQAREKLEQSEARLGQGPFLRITSRSTAQQFRLYVQRGPSQPQPVAGVFNDYGLSKQATVPWF
ncbi:type I-F CRISPR-associated endoribonuclease Cas6/Csy4 [Massilia sp. W12]|uniref:type I-F CRISPR-associated endoribonuclease Cas6/Csy4 n=1 Tax=Massilia sp. W12 TaxID=3126507 RepID=UPI0030D1AEDE